MKIVFFGVEGWIGRMIYEYLIKQGEEVIKTSIRQDDTEAVRKLLEEVKPTNVISTIGRTHGVIDGKPISTIDYLEYPGKLKENIRDNLFSQMSCALICKELGIHYTYMGTGCIFTYTEEEKIFTESSLPNFFGSSYSTVKGFTDRLMNLMDNVLNVRIRMPISNDLAPRSFITKILKYNKICSIPNSMTILPELIPVLYNEIKNGKKGTLNLVNPGVIEHKEILDMFEEIFETKLDYELITYEEQMKILKSERSNNELDASYISENYPEVSNLEEGIRKIIIDLKKEYDEYDKTIAVHIHIGYERLVDEVNNWIDTIVNSNCKPTFYISISEEIFDSVLEKLNKISGMNVYKFENIGFDLGPFFWTLGMIKNEKYILKLHTKGNDKWRNKLVEFMSDVETFNKSLDKLYLYGEKVLSCNRSPFNTKLGDFRLFSQSYYPHNTFYYKQFANDLGIKYNDNMFYTAGTIFLCETNLLKPIIDNLEYCKSNITTKDEFSPYWFSLNYQVQLDNVIEYYTNNKHLPKNFYENPKCFFRDAMKEHAWERLLGALIFGC